MTKNRGSRSLRNLMIPPFISYIFFLQISQVKAHDSTTMKNKFGGYPIITYKISSNGERSLSFPPGMEYPIKKSNVPIIKPEVKVCSVCESKPKKYSCSKTHINLCSLECYKINLENIRNLNL